MRCRNFLRIHLTKIIKASKNHNNNDCGNDDINNKKITHVPHNPVISFLGYKHNQLGVNCKSKGSRNPQGYSRVI